MNRREALAAYRNHGLLLAQANVREDVAIKLLELDEVTVRANHLPGLSAAYDEARCALLEATRALHAIDDSRGEPVTERQREAVAELRRIISACEAALGHGAFPFTTSSTEKGET